MEPLADTEIKRVLVINAHPDDSDFGASGTIAQWVKAGIEVAYVFCTNGDQGGEESGFTKEEMPAIRQREQRAAGAAIGVTDITFLNYVDGHLEATLALRKDIVRRIRISKPDRMLCQSPERNWDRIGASHPDHWVDITDTFELKMAALHAHASQTSHNEELENMVREWGQRNAAMAGLPVGRIAEAFKIVNTN